MAPESWFVLTVAAAFFLLGIAASPLAWVALTQRRSQAERQTDRRFLELDRSVAPVAETGSNGARPPTRACSHSECARERGRGDQAAGDPDGRDAGVVGSGTGEATPSEPRLIAVPNLASTIERSRGHTQRAHPTIRRHLDPGRYRGLARGDRPGDRTAGRADRAHPGIEASDRRSRTTIPHARHD